MRQDANRSGEQPPDIAERLANATKKLNANNETKVRGAVRDIGISVNGAVFRRLYRELGAAVDVVPKENGVELYEIISNTLTQVGYDLPISKSMIAGRNRQRPVHKTQGYYAEQLSDSFARSATEADVQNLVRLLSVCVARSTEKSVLDHVRNRSAERHKRDYTLLYGLQECARYFILAGETEEALKALAAMDAVVKAGQVTARGESEARAEARAACSHATKTAPAALAFLDAHATGYFKTPEVASAYLSILEHESQLLYESGMTYPQLARIAKEKVKWFIDAERYHALLAHLQEVNASLGGHRKAA